MKRRSSSASKAQRSASAIAAIRPARREEDAVEQNKAISDILRILSSSPGDAQKVFDAILTHAKRLCAATFAGVFRYDGALIELAAASLPPASMEVMRRDYPAPPSRGKLSGRVILDRKIVQIPDVREDPKYKGTAPGIGGYRSLLGVPLLRDGKALGLIIIGRQQPGKFAPRQVALVETFAEQAVIAIENARLFNQAKEALEQQTATSQVLSVISRSPSDVAPTYRAILDNVTRLCEANIAALFLYDGELIRTVAHHNATPAFARQLDQLRVKPSRETPTRRAALERRIVHVEDALKDPTFTLSEAHRQEGPRTVLSVPLLREDALVGVITIWRREPRLFTPPQVALVKTFADQAVIAIENARLFNETKEALERQTATAEILRVISSTPTDSQPVFEAIVQSALRIFDGTGVGILLADADRIQLGSAGGSLDLATARKSYPVPLNRESVSGQAILERRVVNIGDIQSAKMPGLARKLGRELDYRAIASAPMLRDGAPIGAITVTRRGAGAFDEKQIDLLKTFADQAVIAIENARLFNETKEALERQTATADILRVISSSPSDLQPVFSTIAHNFTSLCRAEFGTVYTFDGELVHLASTAGFSPERERAHRKRYPVRVDDVSVISARTISTKSVVHVNDVLSDEHYDPERSKALGIRRIIGVPMLRDGVALGAIVAGWAQPGPTPKQHEELLKTFAAQAVIAIENVRLFNETKEALERQTASAEILRVISSTPTDTQPVFDAIVESAQRLLDGKSAILLLRRQADFYVAGYSAPGLGDLPPEVRTAPLDPEKNFPSRVILNREVLNIGDWTGADIIEFERLVARSYGIGSGLQVPLLRKGEGIGVLIVTRETKGLFQDKEIALLRSFADQAVIAIENVRLFNETKDALERQTATAEILRVIASSPSDVQPVFDAIVSSAVRLIGGFSAVAVRVENEMMHLAAVTSTSKEGDEAIRALFPQPVRSDETGNVHRAVQTGRPAVRRDIESDPDTSSRVRAAARARGWRSALAVPMMREGKVIGAINVTRRETADFSPHQIDLLQTFADQAVIAIENVRLFNETKEALEQQTATAEILKVISESPTDTKPVFEAIVQSGLKLFAGSTVFVGIVDGNVLRAEAAGGFAAVEGRAVPITRESAGGIAILERRVVNVPDTEAPDAPLYARENGRRMNVRSMTQMPMFREGQAIGTIGVIRREAGGLDDKQLALLKTFADQAVIAIENVRLFKALQSRTEALSNSVRQLTALGEVGQAISSTLELDKVLQTVVTRAVQLTDLDGGAIYEYDAAAELYNLKAFERFPEEFIDTVRRTPIRKGEGATGRTAVTLEPVQVPDILEHAYQGNRREMLLRAGYRAILAVPLLREENLVGALMVMRKTPGEFAPEVIELLKTFAVQSALAIQNARLYREIEQKSRELETASKHKSQFLASMSHELRTPLNAILGFNEMILDGIYGDVSPDVKAPLENIQTSGKHLLRLINNVLDLAKIEAGRMELALSDYSVQDTVASVHSTLKALAAEKGLEFVADVPADIPLARGDSGRIAQCLMNLAGNSLKFTKEGRVCIAVAQDNGLLRFSVADTGIGIPAEKVPALFTEFKQTDATIASEYGGTGLGLSITKKFIEMHGGRIWVESEPGKGSNFQFEIPLRAAA